MQVQVLDKCSFSNMFSVTNEVKQGCVLAPTLSYILFAAVIYDAFKVAKISVDAAIPSTDVVYLQDSQNIG